MKKIFQLIILTLIVLTIGKINAETKKSEASPFDIDKFCIRKMELVPTLKDGRQKPLYSHSKNTITYLSGHTYWNGESPAVTYCKISLGDKSINLSTPIKHEKILTLLNSALNQNTISYKKLLKYEERLRVELNTSDELYKKSLELLLRKITLYKHLRQGMDWQYPSLKESILKYSPINELIQNKGKGALTHESLLKVILYFNKNYKNTLNLELKYDQIHPESYAILLGIFALILLNLFQKFELTLIVTLISIVIQTLSIAARVFISGKLPTNNPFDLILLLGLGLLLGFMTLGHFRKEKYFVTIALILNTIVLLTLFFNENIFTRSI